MVVLVLAASAEARAGGPAPVCTAGRDEEPRDTAGATWLLTWLLAAAGPCSGIAGANGIAAATGTAGANGTAAATGIGAIGGNAEAHEGCCGNAAIQT